MKKSLRKHLWIGLILTGTISLISGIVLFFTVPLSIGSGHPVQITRLPDPDMPLTEEQVRADALQMTDLLEEVHPLFLEEPSPEYTQAREDYLQACGEAMTVAEFRVLTSRFLTTLQDGHTRLSWSDSRILNVNWRWQEDGLVAGPDCALPENARVLSVGGVPVQDILSLVDFLFPAENDAARTLHRGKESMLQAVLEAAGVPRSDTVTVSYDMDGNPGEAVLPFMDAKASGGDELPDAEWREEKGIFIITLRVCALGSELNETVAALRDALARGVERVIIDVRDNPGGNSAACRKLLEAMDMKLGQYGSTIRFSPEVSRQRGFLRRFGAITFRPDNSAQKNENIQLIVIENEVTFSSATMLAVWVRDGGLGRIVGRPSSNAPSAYGDVIFFQLENSALYGTMSFKKWIRPDSAHSAERELTPDVRTAVGEDPLQTAMDLLAQEPS